MSVKFPMAVGAKHHAFIQLFLNPFPASRVTFARNTEVLLNWIKMMEFQSFYTTIVSTFLALAAPILNCYQTNFFPSRMDSAYKVLPAIAIFTLLFPHQIALCPLHSFATLTRAQPHALPAELQGNNMLKNSGIAFEGVIIKIAGLGSMSVFGLCFLSSS